MDLDVDYRDGAIKITFPPAKGKLVREAGLLFWQPAPGTPPMSMKAINEAIRLSREERGKF